MVELIVELDLSGSETNVLNYTEYTRGSQLGTIVPSAAMGHLAMERVAAGI